VNPQKKLKTYNITYRPNADDRDNTITVTYKADSMDEAKSKFYDEYPKQKDADYFEIHSPLSNYQIDRDNEKIAETPNDDTMKKLNILSIFKTVNEYVQQLTMLIIGLIPLLLLGVVIFGDDFFLGNAVLWNIQNILDSMAGFVGIVTLILIVYFYSRTTKSK
tara:strand:- start:228 stop:716 length:489 start_codon:yes stop_codon:yes gene_type:complete